MNSSQTYDLIVVGGGINGAGITRDAAGRGLSVLLCEAGDLAGCTSSASTKLIHGGLRYLEHYEFKLVAKALREREVLLHAAPHLIRPLRFVMPHQKHLRPAWMIRCGLFLYDHLGGRQSLQGSHGIRLASHPAGGPLKREFTKGFVYSDAAVPDSRLVVLNCMDAARQGAVIRTRTRCEAAQRSEGGWTVRLQPAKGNAYTVRGHVLVNASGPWAVRFLDEIARQEHDLGLRLVKGSHVVVPRMFDHDHAYIFQQPDGRIVFAIPYEQDYTLIGTTDIEYRGALGEAAIDDSEIDYLCTAVNRYFEQSITPSDVVWSYSGVRPLLDDHESNASEITRDYRLQFDTSAAPLLNVFGGKLTTYRCLAEDAVNRIAPALGNEEGAWTGQGYPLPGGDEAKPERLLETMARTHAFIPSPLARRLVFSYGTRVWHILDGAASLEDLGRDFGAGLYQAEVDYLRRAEWAVCAEDIIWRRTKLGLRLHADEVQDLSAYMASWKTNAA